MSFVPQKEHDNPDFPRCSCGYIGDFGCLDCDTYACYNCMRDHFKYTGHCSVAKTYEDGLARIIFRTKA